MPVDPSAHTGSHLSDVKAVLQAGQRVRKTLAADHKHREFAITQLEHAAGAAAPATAYFSFTEFAQTPPTEAARSALPPAAVLAGLLSDLQVANVLLAAGQATGETGAPADPQVLDEALLRLGTTTQSLEQAAASPDAGGIFGFSEAAPPAPAALHSADLPTAIATFHKRADAALDTVVTETRGVVTGVFKALGKLDKDKVLAALGDVGQALSTLPDIGRLFRQGLEKLTNAIGALLAWVGQGAVVAIQKQVQEVWQKVQDGDQVDKVLKWVFAVGPTRAEIATNLEGPGLQQQRLDEASGTLDALAAAFKRDMAIARGVTAAATLAGTVLVLTPLAGPQLALIAAAVDVAVLALVIVLGMDYTDSSRVLRRTWGVADIARDLRRA